MKNMGSEEDGVCGIPQDVIDNNLSLMCQNVVKNMQIDVWCNTAWSLPFSAQLSMVHVWLGVYHIT
jgi:hypothetical protein